MTVGDKKKIIITTSAVSAGFIVSYVAYKKIQEKRARDRKENLITLLKDSALGVSTEEYSILAKKVQYPKIKFKDENGNTPFLYACRYGHAHLVDYILSNLTTLNYKSTVLEINDEGCNAMHLCTHKGYIDTLKLLFQLDPEYIETLVKGKTLEAKWTPLHIAASKGHLDCAQLILSFGVKSIVNEKDSKGFTALLMASCNGFSDIVQLLLNYDADPSIPVGDGRTSLHYAAHNNYPEIVKLILDARQKPAAELWDDDPLFMVNKSNCSALHESTIMGDLESTKLLVEAGADINLTSRDGSTPLTSAIMRDHIDIIKYLLEQPNIDILTPTMFGFTPLISAASKAQSDIVELLLMKKNDLIQNLLYRDNDGSTALHIACQSIINNPIETIKILLNKAKEANLEEYVDSIDFSGSTPLLSACWHDSQYLPDIVNLLLEYGADPRKTNKFGWCCLNVLSQQSSTRSKEIYAKIEEHIKKIDPKFFDTFTVNVKDQQVEYYQHPLIRKHLQIPLKERMNVLDGDVSTRGISKIINKAIQNKNLKVAVLLGDDYMDNSNLPNLSDLEALAYDTENYIINSKEFNKIVKEKYYPIYKNEFEKTNVHKFISFLNEKDLLKYLFTMNIDMMEFQLGIPKEKIITSYGSFYCPKRCTKCQYILSNEEEESCYWNKINENLEPECPKCNGLLQPDIILSPENIEEKFLSYCEALHDVDMLIIIGLKNEIYPVDQLISNVPSKCARLLINKKNIDEFVKDFDENEINSTSNDTFESYYDKSEDEIKKIVEFGGNYRDVVMIGNIEKNVNNLLSKLNTSEE